MTSKFNSDLNSNGNKLRERDIEWARVSNREGERDNGGRILGERERLNRFVLMWHIEAQRERKRRRKSEKEARESKRERLNWFV